MKVGDKLLCIKDFVSGSYNDYDNYFDEDSYYLVSRLWYIGNYREYFGDRVYGMRDNVDYKPSYWVEVVGNYGVVRHFSLLKMGKSNYVYDYFKSIRDIRRDKIRRIEYENR